jgi:hypothetical protein
MNKVNLKPRGDNEPPLAISEWGWRYHHLGVPTKKKFPGEIYLADFKLYVSGFDTSPYGIEWMRYEKDSPIDERIRSVPHIAFEVDDIEKELETRKLNVITKPNSPSPGVKVAMIEHNGAPIELIEFSRYQNC